MLFTISTTYIPATDLGFLLHKHPKRFQQFDLSFGTATIFYPVANNKKCIAALILDVDPVGMVRQKRKMTNSWQFEQYVNDRPYTASSFLSVAIARVYGDALKGKCSHRPELVNVSMPLTVNIAVLPSRGGEQLLHNLFNPLGYKINATRHPLDDKFSQWGMSPYYTVKLEKMTTLKELLSHIYVFIPVLDNQKHYYIDAEEVEKLLKHGKDWLIKHPEKDFITRRYLKYKSNLAKEALARLTDEIFHEPDQIENQQVQPEEDIEKTIDLNEERMGTVVSVLKSHNAKTVIDLGCGEGKLLQILLKDKFFNKITGLDVSIRSLEIAKDRLKLDRLPTLQRERIELIHGSLMYRDKRIDGYDAATAIEVIEHFDPPRFSAFERVLFEKSNHKTIIITTPNREYNKVWESLSAGQFRHSDHRFEWIRKEFQEWCNGICTKYDFKVRFLSIGQEVEYIGSPTQMAIFVRD